MQSPRSLHELAQTIKAQTNLAYFSEYAFKDEENHIPNAPFHNEAYRRLQGIDDNGKIFRPPTRVLNLWPRGHAKSTCFSIKYPLWMLGRNPNLRFLIVTKTSSLADSLVLEIRSHIERNEKVRKVFPDLVAAREEKGVSDPWSGQRLFVKRDLIDKSLSVSGIGLHGSITGRRADVIIFDDLIDESDVVTPMQRQKVDTWVKKVVLPVLTPDGQVIWNATRWHPKDIYGSYLIENPQYEVSILKAINEVDGKEVALWPEMWSLKALKDMKDDIGSLMFECQYQNNATGLEGILFKEEWLSYYNPMAPEFLNKLESMVFVMGVDPAISEEPTADYTAITVLGIDPQTTDCYVMDIWRDRIDFPSQVRKIVEIFNDYAARGMPISKVGIESVAYQKALFRTTYVTGLPVVEVKTSASKIHRMYGLAPSFESGRIKFPDPEIARANWFDGFRSEYLSFPNGANDDQLDSLDFAFEIVGVASLKPAFGFGPP